MKYDIVLQKGRVVDPANGVDSVLDIGIKGGKIVEVGADLPATEAAECFDLAGYIVIPGIIDPHVHVSSWVGGRFGHRMMALAGVTTAVDFSGPIASVLELARDYGAGLNIACLNYVRPGHTVATNDPSREELEKLLLDSLAQGAIGYKILGGHYPLTPEATARAIEVANEHRAYVAFHAGTLANGSNFNGFKEAVELAGKNRLHLAHINSYCRGRVKPVVEEAQEAIRILAEHRHIVSESYLSPFNGTSSKVSGGVPESEVTRTCLEVGGFPPTEEGLAQAIRAGWAQINVEAGGLNKLASGEEAVEYWRARGTNGTVSFPVNPGESRYLLATARRHDGTFVVDALSTDGGGIPRNATVELGLALVKWGAFTLADFVRKTSTNAAAIFGLHGKGHLGPGADADVTVLDWERNKAYLAIAAGTLIMYRGAVVGQGATFITTAAGRRNVEAYGLKPLVIDLSTSGFYKTRQLAGRDGRTKA
jgi:dihydroorotase-like cyclic amidohydrolase